MCEVFFYKIKGQKYILKLVKDSAVRYKTVVYAEYQKALPGDSFTEGSVKFLAAQQKTAAMDVDHDGKKYILSFLRIVNVQAVGRKSISGIGDIGLTYDSR